MTKKTKKDVAEEAPQDAIALDTGRIEQLRFDQLAVSPLNVRKDAEVGADDELVHSIRAHGLLQPLIGYLARSGPAMVLICAGQRRLLALGHIAAPDTKIPVRIVDEQTAIEVSLAENLERKNMNPADELAAFKALIDTGAYDGNRIADRFGFDRRYVRRRLKMAVLHPEILDALRAGAIGVSSAEAYAASSDADLQVKVFKEQSAPNQWRAHAPGQILMAFNAAGIDAETAVGKFIGGVEAYEAEGGTVARDEDFGALFQEEGCNAEAKRLIDHAIVQRLYERAQAAAQEQVEARAKEELPFVTAVDWCDARGNSPKLPKNSDLVLLSTGYTSLGYLDRDAIKHRAEKVAEAGGAVHALAYVTYEGAPTIKPDALLVSKAALELTTPKQEEQARAGASSLSDEDRAELQREAEIRGIAANIYGRSLIGETPGWGVVGFKETWDGAVHITLQALEKREDFEGDRYSRKLREELLEPFMDQARTRHAELVAKRAAAKATANQQRSEFDAKLGELEAKAIEEWPAVTVVTVDDADLVITRLDSDPPVLRLEDEQDDPWENYDPAMVVEVIRDQLGDESTVAIVTYDTAEAYEAEHRSAAREEEAADA